MGYYVEITDADFVIPGKNLQDTYEAMCALNDRDDLKSGGASAGGVRTQHWFSWMDPNYPETCTDAKAILEQLGFYCRYLKDSDDLIVEGYDSKAGQEELFIDAIAHLVPDGSYIDWRDEIGGMWRWSFDGKRRVTKHPTISWD